MAWENFPVVSTIHKVYNCRKNKRTNVLLEVKQMTAKEELKELVLSLTTEELEKAFVIFQDYFATKQEALLLQFPTALPPIQAMLA